MCRGTAGILCSLLPRVSYLLLEQLQGSSRRRSASSSSPVLSLVLSHHLRLKANERRRIHEHMLFDFPSCSLERALQYGGEYGGE